MTLARCIQALFTAAARAAVVPAAIFALLVASGARAIECGDGSGRDCCAAACCSNGADDDNDGRVDCDDPDCAGVSPCGGGGTPENCTNGTDDDGDGLTDCCDPNCSTDAACAAESDCTDGEDNDCDEAADCDDEDCGTDPACTPETSCHDGEDNDGDGRVDCADDDCASLPTCIETDCGNGVDDDDDDEVDCADTDCAGHGCCPGPERCDDLRDNDFDGLIDCEDVDRCIDADACAIPGEICDDEEDNDGDELVDCEDPQCVRFPGCPTPPGGPTPPSLVPSTDSLGCLWPPNHRMVCLGSEDFDFQATGGCGPLSFRIVGCASNQPDDGSGDGHTTGDCVVTDEGVCMRAERQGNSREERVYVIMGVVVDERGVASPSQPVGTFRVPHDSRNAARCRMARTRPAP